MKTIRNIIGKCHSWVLNVYDCLTSKQCEISVGDIILQRAELDHCQFLLTTRKLDVAAFVSGRDKSFPYQNTVSRAVYGTAHKEERGNKHFTDLIISYQSKGYDPSSLLTVDKECRLIDGNHRMGVNLYMRIERLNVRFLNRSSNFKRNTDRYFEMGMKTTFMNEVYNEYLSIQQWLIESGNTFCCVMRGEFKNESVSLIDDIKLMTNVLRLSTFKDSAIVQFSLDFPDYKVHDGELVSRRALEVNRILNLRKKQYGLNIDIFVARNCMEGKNLWLNSNKY